MSSRTKVVVLLMVSLAVGCRAIGGGDGGEARRGEPLELERLQVGSVYGVGSQFESDELEFEVDGFGDGRGNAEVTRAGDATPAVAGQDRPAEASKEKTIRLSHATLRFSAEGVNHLEFDFVDNGGPVGLEIAGEPRTAEDFIELDGVRVGGVLIAVSQASTAGVRHGRVVVSGDLAAFAIAGADLDVRDVRLSRD